MIIFLGRRETVMVRLLDMPTLQPFLRQSQGRAALAESPPVGLSRIVRFTTRRVRLGNCRLPGCTRPARRPASWVSNSPRVRELPTTACSAQLLAAAGTDVRADDYGGCWRAAAVGHGLQPGVGGLAQ